MSKHASHVPSGTLLQTCKRWLFYRVWCANAGDASRPNRMHIWLLDLRNRLRYGKNAPRFAELIFVNPRACLVSNTAFKRGQLYSGTVIDYWPYRDEDLVPALSVEDLPVASAVVGILQSSLKHWRNGAPWEETWNYKRIAAQIAAHGEFWLNQLYSMDELNERCRTLDALFERVSTERKLCVRSEYAPNSFRQEDTTMIHVGPKGTLVVAGLGLHRFAMALAAGLSRMPAQIGCVHRDALDHLPALRSADH